jgi:TonB family protein
MNTQRRKKNSSKVNLTISFVFHGVLIAAVFYFAAREGMLGKKMKTIVAEMVREKKPVEPPKPKEEPKVAQQQPKTDEPKTVAATPPPQTQVAAPPTEAPPTAAPPSVDVPTLDFQDGAKAVVTVSDPKLLYKGLVELALRSRWNRPEDVADETYVAEVELNVDPKGNVTGYKWIRGSGDARWDKSVKEAVAATKVINRPPPKGFPGAFVARFDVEMMKSEEVLKVGSIQ